MPTAVVDGIATEYELVGSGPPLLMFSPGGFNAQMKNWRHQGIYAEFKPLDHLPEKYTCIIFDRRETGRSGGRVERITWAHYVRQAKGLLDHLGIEQAHVMGGCQGCAPAAAMAVLEPQAVRSVVLFWPAGGPRYRIRNHAQFAQHRTFAREQGLAAVVELARSTEVGFGQDPRIGPWGAVFRHDEAFAEEFVRLDPDHYDLIVSGMVRELIDRDSGLGAEPEDLLRLDVPALIIPGHDPSHGTSVARYFEECIPGSQYWDLPVPEQTEETVSPGIIRFLEAVERGERPS